MVCNCDNVAISDFILKKILLGQGYDSIGSLQWRSRGSNSLLLYFRHFKISYRYMKINCMNNSLKIVKKLFGSLKLTEVTVYAIIHHHVLQWF